MPFTNADYLPSYEELTVPEINMSAAPLRASAQQFGKYCDHECKEFMLCSEEEKDPRKCLREGKAVTMCGVKFFNKMRRDCAEEFTTYWKCIDHAGCDMHFRHCRQPQVNFDKCMLEKFNMEKPPVGYFSKVRVHCTNRPRPERDIPMPDPVPGPPDLKGQPEPESAKFGSRILMF